MLRFVPIAALMVTILFVMLPARAQPVALEDSAWTATTVGTTEALDATPPRLAFDAEGKVSGTSGCNRFFGTFERKGETLILGPLAATKMACAGPEDAQERAVLAALSQVRGYVVEGDALILKNGEGAELMRLWRD